MDGLEDAGPEDEARIGRWAYNFYAWQISVGKKDTTAKAFSRTIVQLYEEDRKSVQAMGSEQYYSATKKSLKNKVGNGQRSAALKGFMDFLSSFGTSADKLEEIPDQLRARYTARAIEEAPDTEETKAFRLDLGLPEDWRVAIDPRPVARRLMAMSPGRRAYRTRAAVDERLGRTGGAARGDGGGPAERPLGEARSGAAKRRRAASEAAAEGAAAAAAPRPAGGAEGGAAASPPAAADAPASPPTEQPRSKAPRHAAG